ncbi:MAG TPA: hypothetical protein VG944_23665 [Fimbriimonas sp.]|nr:hypothetical protein [Fimbriimonas sp.]
MLPFPPAYDVQHIAGWTVRVSTPLEVKQPALWQAARAELTIQLESIARVVPDKPLKSLRTVVIYVHASSPETLCAAFHPDAGWLKEHHMEAEMAHCVEIGNAANFVSWTYEQPWMILHELAHAYNALFLPKGFDNPDVKAAFDAAMKAKRYEAVTHWDGKTVKAYATTNPMEYFSECTEAYFGTNDFFPFVRGELKNADPDGYSLMKKIWGEPQKRLN